MSKRLVWFLLKVYVLTLFPKLEISDGGRDRPAGEFFPNSSPFYFYIMKLRDRFVVLGRLSSTLAHEIRNPLAGISAVTQVLDGKIDADDPRKKYINLILREIERVNKLVYDLLSYTRRGKSYFMRVDVHSLIDKVLSSQAQKFSNRKIEVRKRFGEQVPAVMVDCEQIELAFINIVINAIEAMEEGGILTVETEIEGKEPGEVAIEFIDTGKGSELEDLSELFSPFYTTKTQGVGLGLAVTSKIVEDHNGTVSAEKNREKGLKFTVFLPVNQAEE